MPAEDLQGLVSPRGPEPGRASGTGCEDELAVGTEDRADEDVIARAAEDAGQGLVAVGGPEAGGARRRRR